MGTWLVFGILVGGVGLLTLGLIKFIDRLAHSGGQAFNEDDLDDDDHPMSD